MAKYLAMEYSEDIYSWFSSSTIAIAKSIEWEAVLCLPAFSLYSNLPLHLVDPLV